MAVSVGIGFVVSLLPSSCESCHRSDGTKGRTNAIPHVVVTVVGLLVYVLIAAVFVVLLAS